MPRNTVILVTLMALLCATLSTPAATFRLDNLFGRNNSRDELKQAAAAVLLGALVSKANRPPKATPAPAPIYSARLQTKKLARVNVGWVYGVSPDWFESELSSRANKQGVKVILSRGIIPDAHQNLIDYNRHVRCNDEYDQCTVPRKGRIKAAAFLWRVTLSVDAFSTNNSAYTSCGSGGQGTMEATASLSVTVVDGETGEPTEESDTVVGKASMDTNTYLYTRNVGASSYNSGGYTLLYQEAARKAIDAFVAKMASSPF